MPSASPLTYPPIALSVRLSDDRSTFKPGDLITVHAEVCQHQPLEALSLHASLIGQTRVWKHPDNRDDLFETMIYTHLDQASGFPYTLPAINNTSVGENVSIPITFVLPELTKSSKFPAGRMPPSCETGPLYVDPAGRSYMQPLIEYSIEITLGYRLADERTARSIIAKEKIKVTASPHSGPPTYDQSLSDLKPTTASADVARSRFSKPFARLELSMAEPTPIVGRAVGGACHTTADIRMTWDTSSEAYDEFELGQWPLRIECKLQARTRYDTQPIRSDVGSNEAISGKSKSQIWIGTINLGTFEVRPSDRKNIQLAEKGSKGRSHTGTISLPVRVNGGTIPTFSHLLASRDYAVVVKASIQGLHHAPLYLKTPLQICESIAKAGGDNRQRKATESSDAILAEVLPRYEDHRDSLIP